MIRKDPDISEEDAKAFFREADSLKISDDMFGSEEYKRYLLGVTAYDFCRKLAGKEV
jgi:CO/xanthine dehydrogenase FAD-binding subunit